MLSSFVALRRTGSSDEEHGHRATPALAQRVTQQPRGSADAHLQADAVEAQPLLECEVDGREGVASQTQSGLEDAGGGRRLGRRLGRRALSFVSFAHCSVSLQEHIRNPNVTAGYVHLLSAVTFIIALKLEPSINFKGNKNHVRSDSNPVRSFSRKRIRVRCCLCRFVSGCGQCQLAL